MSKARRKFTLVAAPSGLGRQAVCIFIKVQIPLVLRLSAHPCSTVDFGARVWPFELKNNILRKLARSVPMVSGSWVDNLAPAAHFSYLRVIVQVLDGRVRGSTPTARL